MANVPINFLITVYSGIALYFIQSLGRVPYQNSNVQEKLTHRDWDKLGLDVVIRTLIKINVYLIEPAQSNITMPVTSYIFDVYP